MVKKNVAHEVFARIEKMTSEKTSALKQIQDKKKEAQEQKEAAEKAIAETTAQMDLEAYEEAIQAKQKAQTALNMYSGKYVQVVKQEFISESESNDTIDSLLSYEDELATDFKENIKEPIARLNELLTAYYDAVGETEDVIKKWTTEIHANYRSEGTIYADGTNRSPVPVPVRRLPYNGCSEAERINRFLEGMD